MRPDNQLQYSVNYTYGYPVPPDFVRGLISMSVEIALLTFCGSPLGVAEASSKMK
jgi:hypothetical protein